MLFMKAIIFLIKALHQLGYTFSGCGLAFSGPASNVNNDSVAAKALDGINLSGIFED